MKVLTGRRPGARARPKTTGVGPTPVDRSFEELDEDLDELDLLARGARERLALTWRRLLDHRRELYGDSLDLIEQHLRMLVSSYDAIGRDVRRLRADARSGPRGTGLLAGLTAERHACADRLRTLQAMVGGASTASEWQSPSFAHSVRSNAGVNTGSVRPHVDDYRRDRHPDAGALEAELLAAYVDPEPGLELRALLTSCGMSAFATIVTFLAAAGGLDGRVIAGTSVYHECIDLLRDIIGPDRLFEIPEHPRSRLPAEIERLEPSAVFLDSIGNAPGTLVPDVPAVVRALAAGPRPTYLVLDNTGLSCAFQPFRLLRGAPGVRLIMFESLTKYAQFGLDRVTGGLVVAEGADAEALDVRREHLGSNIPDASVHAVPRPDRPALERRLARLERNAIVLARAIRTAAVETDGLVVAGADHPALGYHPSNAVAAGLSFRGGWLSVAFAPGFDRPEIHHRFVDIAVEEAGRRDVPLIAGASFGLDTTRVYATTWVTSSGSPFVRVSPGIEHLAGIQAVAEALASAVDRIAHDPSG